MKKSYILLYLLLLVALSVATLEIGARVIVGESQPNPDYLAISEGFEDLDQLLLDRRECGKQKAKFFEYFIYSSPPCQTPTVNVRNYLSARATPSSQPGGTVIWTFGGSTMKEWETTDQWTIANTIAEEMNASGLKVRVENFGVGSYQSSMELVKFVTLAARVPEEELPQIVVFYHGGNDANHGMHFGPGAIQNDLSQKLSHLVERRTGKLLLYAASLSLANGSVFWSAFVHPRLERALFKPTDPRYNEETLRRSVDIYLRNLNMVEGVCARINAECFFVLQPLIITKESLGEVEKKVVSGIRLQKRDFMREFYRRVKMAKQGDRQFIDATGVFNETESDVFYDFVHTSPFAGRVTGAFIANALVERLDLESEARKRAATIPE